jgi:hypothetical protein
LNFGLSNNHALATFGQTATTQVKHLYLYY